MFINNTAEESVNIDIISLDLEMDISGEDITRSSLDVTELSLVLLLLTFTSLLSNFSYLIWSSFYTPARSSLLILLSLADISLIFCGVSLTLSFPHGATLTKFSDQLNLAIILHFSLGLFFPLLSIVAVVFYLIKEVFITIKTENHYTTEYKAIEKCEEQKIGMRNLFQLMIPSCVFAFLITCFFTTNISSCLTQSEPLSSISGYSAQCSLSYSTWVTPTISQLLLNPLHFPLTVMAVLPVLICLAQTNTLFLNQENISRHGRKIGWVIFLCVYSLFITDLVMFSQGYQDSVMDLQVQPLEWRRSAGTMARTTAVFLIHLVCL